MKNKTYADQCLERAEKATEGPWAHSPNLLESKIITEDVPELSKRLKKACEELREQAQAFAEGHNGRECRRFE